MSETRTVYIVRGWAMGEREFTSRRQAEAFAAEVDGKVVRRTITEDEVGLVWHEQVCGRACKHWALYDARRFERKVNTDAAGTIWYVFDWGGHQVSGPYDTLVEAKAEAERLARETWT